MAYRSPSCLPSFLPPPSSLPISNLSRMPWRGLLVVSGLRTLDRNVTHDIRVTAVETDGDNRMDLWPQVFSAHCLAYELPVLRPVQEWVRRHQPPICTFMSDRLRDPNENAVNNTTFRSLSRLLYENQTVALSPWPDHSRFPGAGIIIFPTENTSSLLIGAMFLASPFPDFVAPSYATP
ncbi:hypothetical protein FISHEDRAFT_8650, partial [Fistulina hepatica ATCC 64428]